MSIQLISSPKFEQSSLSRASVVDLFCQDVVDHAIEDLASGDVKTVSYAAAVLDRQKPSSSAALAIELCNAIGDSSTEAFHQLLGDHMLLSNAQGKTVRPLVEKLLAQYTDKKNADLDLCGEVFRKVAVLGYSFPEWRFLAMRYGVEQESFLERIGLTKIDRSLIGGVPANEVDLKLGLGFICAQNSQLTSPELDKDVIIELRRGYILASHPAHGSIIIRNSSHFFGRDLLQHPAYFSEGGLTKKSVEGMGKSMIEDPKQFSPLHHYLGQLTSSNTGTSCGKINWLVNQVEILSRAISAEIGIDGAINPKLAGFFKELEASDTKIKPMLTAKKVGEGPWFPEIVAPVLSQDENQREISEFFAQAKKLGLQVLILSSEKGDFPSRPLNT